MNSLIILIAFEEDEPIYKYNRLTVVYSTSVNTYSPRYLVSQNVNIYCFLQFRYAYATYDTDSISKSIVFLLPGWNDGYFVDPSVAIAHGSSWTRPPPQFWSPGYLSPSGRNGLPGLVKLSCYHVVPRKVRSVNFRWSMMFGLSNGLLPLGPSQNQVCGLVSVFG